MIKDTDKNWNDFVREVLPAVVAKSTFEKQFIANAARLAIQNAVMNAPVPNTCAVLIDHGSRSKNLKLTENSLSLLATYVDNKHGSFFVAGNPVSRSLA